ncbi:MAG: MBL fold metallo-hydrolase [Gemmatimonadota bacterium]
MNRWVTLLVTLGIATPLAAQSPTTSVILLGTGMPRPNPAASGPATAITVGDRLFLFDAGPGVMRQLAAAGLPISGPTALFLTHLHSDHTLGYPDLVLTSWVMRRTHPFPVYGPPGTARFDSLVHAAWATDIRVRTEGLEREIAGGDHVTVREFAKAGVIYDSAGVVISAIRVSHGDFPNSYGFKIVTPDRVIVISGDTAPNGELERAARGADVLVHEVYSAAHLTPEGRPGGESWPAYMRAFHTSDVEVGEIASRARPKLLLLTHIIRMGATDAELLAGVREGGYAGRVEIGRDLGRW